MKTATKWRTFGFAVIANRTTGKPDSASWEAVDQLSQRLGRGCRFYVTEFPTDQRDNHCIEVLQTRWIRNGAAHQPALSIRVTNDAAISETVPVAIRAGGVTQSIDVEVVRGVGERSALLLEIGEGQRRVFGEVSIPADVNAADDRWFFAATVGQGRPIALITEEQCVRAGGGSGCDRTTSRRGSGSGGAGQGSRRVGATDSVGRHA